MKYEHEQIKRLHDTGNFKHKEIAAELGTTLANVRYVIYQVIPQGLNTVLKKHKGS